MSTIAAPYIGVLSRRRLRPQETPTDLRESGALSARQIMYADPSPTTRASNVALHILPGSPAWISPVATEMLGLLSLPPGWDTYNAPAIDPRRVVAAFITLASAVRKSTPRPAIVPTLSGGVQLEWHTRGIDLEIEALSESHVEGVFYDHQTDTNWERDLSVDLTAFVEAISLLTNRSSR